MSWLSDPTAPKSIEEAEAMLRSQAPGPPAMGDDDPWDFARRYSDELNVALIWPAVSRLLEDGDPIVRSRAIFYVSTLRACGQEPLERVLALATSNAPLFRESSQVDELAFALSNLSTVFREQAPRIARALIELYGDAPLTNGVSLIAAHEPAAVIERAGRWKDGEWSHQRGAASAASVIAHFRRDHLLDLLAALKTRSLDDRKEIMAEAESSLKAGGAEAGPTLEECRRALGLE